MTVTTKITGLSRNTTASAARQFATLKRTGQLGEVGKTYVVWNVDPTSLLVIIQSEMDELFGRYGADDRDRKFLSPIRDKLRCQIAASSGSPAPHPKALELAACVQVNQPPEDNDVEQVSSVISAVAELYVVAREHRRYGAARDLLEAVGFAELRWPEKDEMIDLLADVLS